MPLVRRSISVTLTLSKQCITCILGVTLPTVGRFSLYKRKPSELLLVHNTGTSCRRLFKQVEILPVACQWCTNFTIHKQETFQRISSVNSIITRNEHHLHRPNANLCCYQKSALYADIEVFNVLPSSRPMFKNDKTKFTAAPSTVQYSTVQYSTVQYSTVQYSTVQHSTAQHSTVQYSTVQHSTVQFSTEVCY